MKKFFEKWYFLFMLMLIAKHNKIRENFRTKYEDIFSDYGELIEDVKFVRCHEKDKKLFRRCKDKSEHIVAENPHKDDFGLYEYVEQHYGYCEDDLYGNIYTKTPIKNLWLERGFHCY